MCIYVCHARTQIHTLAYVSMHLRNRNPPWNVRAATLAPTRAPTASPDSPCPDSMRLKIALCRAPDLQTEANCKGFAQFPQLQSCTWCPSNLGLDAGCYRVDPSVFCTSDTQISYIAGRCPMPVAATLTRPPTETPTRPPTTEKPTASPAWLAWGGMGSNACLAGSDMIVSEAKCQAAAAATGRNYIQSGSWYDVPRGCYGGHSNSLYFNTHPTGGANQWCQPLCAVPTGARAQCSVRTRVVCVCAMCVCMHTYAHTHTHTHTHTRTHTHLHTHCTHFTQLHTAASQLLDLPRTQVAKACMDAAAPRVRHDLGCISVRVRTNGWVRVACARDVPSAFILSVLLACARACVHPFASVSIPSPCCVCVSCCRLRNCVSGTAFTCVVQQRPRLLPLPLQSPGRHRVQIDR
jgi:hypothetical protein